MTKARRWLFAIAFSLLVASAATANAEASATYYVSPQGSDAAPGTAPDLAWRTVDRVNSAALVPGDVVLFEGGGEFADATLVPPASGAPGAPITFGSFGAGRAVVRGGIWLRDRHDLVFENLELDGGEPGPSYSLQGILASGNGGGSPRITVRRCVIRHFQLAVNLANVGDTGWLIADNTISDIGDSGILIEDANETNGRGASDVVIERNEITNTGQASLPFGLHGIYTRGPRTVIRRNRITHFRDSGISFRFNDTTVEGNVISHGLEGITWFPYATTVGVSQIAYNVVTDVTGAAMFVDDAQDGIEQPQETRESFVIVNNTFLPGPGAEGVNVQPRRSASLTFANNVVVTDGAYLFTLPYRPPTYVEKHNLWYAGGAERWRYLDTSFSTLTEFRAASGRGENDLVAAPGLEGSELVPAADSPAIDLGSLDVAAFSPACDGGLYAYCGNAPDAGAVERSQPDGPPEPDTTPPAMPSGLTAVAGDRTVTLDWADNEEADLAGYRIERRAGAGDWGSLTTTAVSAWSDSGLMNGTAYSYRVTALDRAGNESDPSASVTATPVAPVTTTSYLPSGWVITTGVRYAGSLSSLFTSNNSRLEIASRRVGTPHISDMYVRAVLGAADRADAKKLAVDYEGNATGSSTSLWISLYDWAAGAWTTVAGPWTGATTDRVQTWSQASPSAYVSPSGEVRLRIFGWGQSSFRSRTDWVRFTVTR